MWESLGNGLGSVGGLSPDILYQFPELLLSCLGEHGSHHPIAAYQLVWSLRSRTLPLNQNQWDLLSVTDRS